MDESERLAYWIALAEVPGITGAQWRSLLAAFGSPAAVLQQSETSLARVVDPRTARAIRAGADPKRLEAAAAWAGQPGQTILTLEDDRYPQLLRETPDPPPVLYARGRVELLRLPALAIVGSRNASAQGMRNAESFARALSANGICIVSGLALGIDAAAHRGALQEAGSSIAVLGCGIDVIYPRRNAELFETLAASGLLLSEFGLGTPPLSGHFPRRNRIIAGLSRGCLVVEAALASGSLITARIAVDMGRDVFAIPGSIHSPLSKGCHRLIKQGAKLVDDVADILDELGIARAAIRPQSAAPELDPEEARVLNAMGHDPCEFDALVARTGMAVDRVMAILTQLELAGRVSRSAQGGYVRLD